MLTHRVGTFPTLSLPLGGAEPILRRAHHSLAAMFRLQADMLLADGDGATARGLRRRARMLEVRQAAAELRSGARVIVGVTGHA